MKTFKQLKAELMQSPEFRAEYERLRPEFELAKTIIATRTAQGLTQAELAARMNTSQSYIARLESGRVLPSMRTWQRLAAATGTRPRVTLEPVAGR
ncbi:MAG: transcriptional regulator, family [Proteobacteria bacterium]|nr:transcriptional regulator, family [Pseudomonadota bacterium]